MGKQWTSIDASVPMLKRLPCRWLKDLSTGLIKDLDFSEGPDF